MGQNLKEFPIDDKDVLFSACLMVSHYVLLIRFVYYHSYWHFNSYFSINQKNSIIECKIY